MLLSYPSSGPFGVSEERAAKDKMFYYNFHVRDYLTKTRHLSLLEDLAYRRLLDTYYTEEGSLPADPQRVARLIAMPDHVAEVTLVLNEFFTQTDDGWRNDRADLEISGYHARAEVARANGKRGGRKPKETQSVPSGNPVGTQSQPSGVPKANPGLTQPKANQEPRTKKQEPVSVDGFVSFWTAYPKKVAKPEAMKAWIKVAPDAELTSQIMAGLARAKQSKDWTKDDGQFIPHPTTWLNQRRWEDEVGAAAAGGEDHFGGLL